MSRLFKEDSTIPQEVLDFIEVNRDREIELEQFLQNHTNTRSLHNHTIENLFLYFHLERFILKERVIVYPNVIFIVDNRRYKFFINDSSDFLKSLDFSPLVDYKIKKKFTLYSSHLQNIDRESFDYTKSKEFVYDLDYILSKEAYREKYSELTAKKIKKKIYNRLDYPFIYLSKLDFREEDITESNLSDALKVHDEWVTYKQNDPSVFQMMFSSNRYNKCIEKMFDHDYVKRQDYFAKIFYLDGKPVAVRQCLIEGDRSFDIGFFSLYWELPSNMINYINTYCLASLQSLGIKIHNCGMAFDKKNSISKAHFPGKYEEIYTYKIK